MIELPWSAKYICLADDEKQIFTFLLEDISQTSLIHEMLTKYGWWIWKSQVFGIKLDR